MDFDSVYLQVLKYLNFRPRSEKEIRDYLKRKLSTGVIARRSNQSSRNTEEIATSFVSLTPRNDDLVEADNNTDSLVDLIIHKLKQQRFLNDLEFARMWVRSRTEFKPKGWRLVKLELKQKGISDEIIKDLEVEIKDQESENEDKRPKEVDLAAQILERKMKKYETMEKRERFNKAGSYLARKGFDLDTIRKAIDQVFGK